MTLEILGFYEFKETMKVSSDENSLPDDGRCILLVC